MNSMEIINLAEMYKESYTLQKEIKEFQAKSNLDAECNGFKASEEVVVVNSYGLKMLTKILGFKDGKAYLYWDCYWFPVELKNILKNKI